MGADRDHTGSTQFLLSFPWKSPLSGAASTGTVAGHLGLTRAHRLEVKLGQLQRISFLGWKQEEGSKIMKCKDEKSLHQPRFIEHLLCARPYPVLWEHRLLGSG